MYCQGEMKEGTAPFSVDRGRYHITWSNIPALICNQCGEPYFEEQEVEHIQSALSELDNKTSILLNKGYISVNC
jgi:YgiT-type zinc finger domain-containing protein